MRARAKRLVDGLLDRLVTLRMRLSVSLERAESLDTAELLERTDELNRAAERYFRDAADTGFLRRKPFSSPEYARQLFNLGVLFHWGRVSPGDTVADFGAGSCWVAHFLNLYGCRTIAVDVSPTALELGEQLFREHPWTRWDLDPRFIAYDGYSIPLEDSACDRVIIHDAFHHVPNQEGILRELARITRDGGIVAMCEPGRMHSCTEESRHEVETTGVLENDIVVEELARLARDCGFRDVNVVPLSLGGASEVAAENVPAFLTGRGLMSYWSHHAQALLGNHFILLYKGAFRPTSRQPGGLRAGIELLGDRRMETTPGAPVAVPVRVVNEGEARWLDESGGVPGATRLGAHLNDSDGAVVDYDWYRLALPGEIAPGQREELTLELIAPAEPGRYTVEIDLVAEGVAWFAQNGSPTATLTLDVTASGAGGNPRQSR